MTTKWLDVAKDNLGLKEVAGKGSNPKVAAFYCSTQQTQDRAGPEGSLA